MGEQYSGGRGGIRTHGTLSGTPVFKTGAINHSATLPEPCDCGIPLETSRAKTANGAVCPWTRRGNDVARRRVQSLQVMSSERRDVKKLGLVLVIILAFGLAAG